MTLPEVNKPNNFSYCLQNLKIFFQEYLSCNLFKSSGISKGLPKCYYGNVFRQFIDISYFTVVIPVLVLIILTVITFILIIVKAVSCCLKRPQPSTPLKKPDRIEIKLTEEQTQLLVASLEQLPINIFKNGVNSMDITKLDSDIEWLSVNGVFRHRNIPGLIFRIPLEHSGKLTRVEIKNMFNFANKCWQICQEKNLDLLEVPNVGIAYLGHIHERHRYILISEELDFQPDFEDQFFLKQSLSENYNYSRLLQRVEEQILEFVVASGYSDVKYSNLPILNRKSTKDPIKVAIIDFDQYEPHLTYSFFGWLCCYSEYNLEKGLLFIINSNPVLQDLLKKASQLLPEDDLRLKEAIKIRSELKSFQKKQEKLHQKRRFKTGREPFNLNVITLEDFKDCVDPQLGYEVAQDVLNRLNLCIGSSKYKSKILIRQAIIHNISTPKILQGLMKDVVKGFNPKNQMEAFEGSLLKQVCEVLLKKEIIVSYRCFKEVFLKFWF